MVEASDHVHIWP